MPTLVLNVIHFLAEVQRQQGESGLHLINLITLHEVKNQTSGKPYSCFSVLSSSAVKWGLPGDPITA